MLGPIGVYLKLFTLKAKFKHFLRLIKHWMKL